ncbi:hypothetical protein JM93_04103 [Roseibium hamelinense]|uniref:Avidin family protein n=1 Tax=Roseibium hamelinense TaxID=150831 RepID=A0A562SF59_9HYPH|nr:hypothetical protein [Roseibium hamelinense]MTI44224.1 hypothetical protein [Roseibium hamelinense]TWI79991.1 hypothetical protein JM93_04103 [Roseibium hamelinense]
MKALALAAAFAALSTGAFAAELASGEAITAAISGKTVQGSMSDSGAYTEFYAADGTIRGNGYTGTWTVSDDEMCFAYGEEPSCWGVVLDGTSVSWIKDGKTGGTGTIVDGNPNGF